MTVRYIALPQAQEQLAQRIKIGNELLEALPVTAVADTSQLWEQYMHWHTYNRTWLDAYLGHGVCHEYEGALNAWLERDEPSLVTDIMASVLPSDISGLKSIMDRLDIWLPESGAKSSGYHASHDAPIFIVHGSDTLRAESVAHTVTSVTGRKTIILRDEPNSGRTLIEKFEQHAAEVAYAIIVLTADDKGGRVDETGSQPRARQNVIFEMGYFYGLIGRDRVSVLLRPGVEKPSDMDGIAYIAFDDNRAWKTELFRELKHAGFDIRL